MRLGRRGIILSLFINGLNISLYLIILVAACLNIIEASVNFIILNVFAASFACLLIVSEIRLPQITYEYFRFLCTYRGRGLAYLFFGCLVASRIAFNLYGGIIVVCMGFAFFMLSYVKMIPPLDGLILNYKKLDQWKEQKHFRVQFEAQKIFEQQLQQEQNMARVVLAHHHNPLTVHGHMAMGSPKQIGQFQGSINFPGAGVGAGTGALTSMSSPSMSLSHTSMSTQQQLQCGDYEPQFSHHQSQNKLQDSNSQDLTDMSRSDNTTTHGGNIDRVAIGRGKGRIIQSHAPFEEQSMTDMQKQQQTRRPMQLNKSLPPIVIPELEDFNTSAQRASFILSPPPTRHRDVSEPVPESPLQYLNVGGEDLVEQTQDLTVFDAPNDKPEYQGSHDNSRENRDDSILRSAPQSMDLSSQQRTTQQHQKFPKLDQQQFPLRTTNKPAPPHDPFRKTSISSIHSTQINLPSLNSATPTSGRAHYQSLYQPPEPPSQTEKIHPFQLPQHPIQYYNDPSALNRRAMPLSATGQILSSIGGISRCYTVVGGAPSTATLAATAGSGPIPLSSHQETHSSCNCGGSHDSPPNTPRHQPLGRQRSQLQPETPKRYMPDIVLTLPTPAGNASRKDEYFAM
ncbi:hypothetical protein BGZ46_003584 [Entomortierella lignicola]|nr:hypothetical protein BGZ46_003584 [Entomortierella lignicola]